MRFSCVHPVCLRLVAGAFALLLVQPPASIAQTTYQHDAWTVENSDLPVNSATAITETEDGFLWIGTWQGLVRFDGTEFKVFDALSNPGLESDRITALHAGPDGSLWIGTANAGIFRYREGRFTAHPSDAAPTEEYVVNFFESGDGRVWVLYIAYRVRVIEIDGDSVSINVDSEIPGSDMRMIVDARSDSARWIARKDTLVREQDGVRQIVDVPNWAISSMLEAPDGTIWIGTAGPQGSVTSFRQGLQRNYALVDAWVEAMLADSRGNVWVAAGGRGLLRLENDRFAPLTFDRGTPVGTHPTSLYEDRSGSIWIGTTGNGLHRIREPSVVMYGDEVGIPEHQILGLHRDRNGNIWIGTATDGFFRLRSGTVAHSFEMNDGLASKRVWTIGESAGGKILIGTEGGLLVYDDGVFDAIALGPVRAITNSPSGVLVGGSYGLFGRFDDGRFKPLIPAADVGRMIVQTIAEDDAGVVWFGTTTSGLCRLDPELECGLMPENPGYRAVRAIYPVGDGTLWIGTYGGGLCEFSQTLNRCLTINDGLPDGTIHSIAEDSLSRVWLSSNAGIFVYGRSDLESFFRGELDHLVPDILDVNDGLHGSETNGGFQPAVASTVDGKLWYPTTAGVAVIDPSRIERPKPPRVQITALTVDGNPTDPADGFYLPPGSDRLVFSFAGLNLVNPDENRFRYRLEGHDAHWIEASSDRTAIYTNLSPATYRLRVQAAAGSSDWSEADLPFSVRPFFYQTIWFGFLVLLAIGAAGFSTYRLRIRNLRRQRDELEKIVADRTRRLTELDRAKNKLFANISHEFRTPLQLILGPIEAAERRPSESDWTRLRAVAVRNTRKLLDLVDELLDLARIESDELRIQPEPGDINGFVGDLVLQFAPLAERSGLRLDLYQDLVGTSWYLFDPKRLEKAIGNLIANAIRYTPAGGRVTISLSTPPERPVRIRVSDTGPGIPRADQERIFNRFEQGRSGLSETGGTGIGLALAREFVELHGGEIQLESQPGDGSHFTVVLPLKRSSPDESSTDQMVRREPPPAASPDLAPSGNGLADVDDDRARVLVADDHPDVLALLSRFLNPKYAVIEAADGREALRLARRHVPDVILSDIMMPEMDGLALVRSLRRSPKLSTVPVILVTARASERDAVEGLETGADDYLTKPVSKAELLARVDRLLKARGKMRERFTREVRIEPAGVTVPSDDETLILKATGIVEENLSSYSFGVNDLADEVGLSARQLARRLRGSIGESPGKFIQRLKMEHAARLIVAGSGTIAEIAHAVGFQDASYFSAAFRRHFGHLPSEHR